MQHRGEEEEYGAVSNVQELRRAHRLRRCRSVYLYRCIYWFIYARAAAGAPSDLVFTKALLGSGYLDEAYAAHRFIVYIYVYICTYV